MSEAQANEAEKNIEIWKVKKLIKRLEAARGNGTSMISLIIPPKDQVSRISKMLAEEYVRPSPQLHDCATCLED
jgi:peptide chain release factor subunit 1